MWEVRLVSGNYAAYLRIDSWERRPRDTVGQHLRGVVTRLRRSGSQVRLSLVVLITRLVFYLTSYERHFLFLEF